LGELISVVIPAYNVSKYVGSAISSVMDQTYKDVEIIVVDDCSTDDTAKTLDNFRDRTTILRHETNQGAAAARNTGVKACRGEIVAFLDGSLGSRQTRDLRGMSFQASRRPFRVFRLLPIQVERRGVLRPFQYPDIPLDAGPHQRA
jgi:hypothetical protein